MKQIAVDHRIDTVVAVHYLSAVLLSVSVFILCSECGVTVLNQADNPIYDDKGCNNDGVDHLGNELNNLKRKGSLVLGTISLKLDIGLTSSFFSSDKPAVS